MPRTTVPPPANITLIGMPGVGKSTLGVLLAKHIRYDFVDIDLLIQSGEQASLRQIIHDRGIEAFCGIEAGYIRRLTPRRTVIATGGSAVYDEAAMAHLERLGCILFLDIELPCLAQRLGNLVRRGVVLMPGQTLEQLYAQRRPLYSKYAHLTVQCADQTPDRLVHRIMAVLAADPLYGPLIAAE